jgi:hypothetical protein
MEIIRASVAGVIGGKTSVFTSLDLGVIKTLLKIYPDSFAVSDTSTYIKVLLKIY